MDLRRLFVNRIVWLMVLAGAMAPIGASAAEPPVPGELIEGLKSLKTADAAKRQAFYDLVAKKGDARLATALTAYRDGQLQLKDDRLVAYGPRINVPGQGSVLPLIDAITREPVKSTDGQPIYVQRPDLSGAMRAPPPAEKRLIGGLLSSLSLNDPNPAKRKDAIQSAGDREDETLLPILETQLKSGSSSAYSTVLKESIGRIKLAKGTREQKLEAADLLTDVRTNNGLTSLQKARDVPENKSDAELSARLDRAISAGESYQTRIRWIQNTFAGLSLSSILILLALGLSIIFGLMGVINMAHGEFMMVGAFTTYVVSEFWKAHLPGLYDYYLLSAIPAAFLAAGLIGFVCEIAVIRHLYGRPLETLLATWGIGLILIQTARVGFGDTLSVTPPKWMEGGIEVMPDLYFPLNRLFIIFFCAACIAAVYFIVNKTKLGLLLRATTQNRDMASALGVPTRRVDALTFAFGAGLAGLAGVVVPLYNKINPSIGQEYIVDSFMVVVVGGVGKLAGAIIAGLGLGFLSKYLEPLLQNFKAMESSASVIGKVVVLGLIVVFLQWRPSGLFPPRGRMADA
ncbi:MAG TPA: urea ABC transporter permease subunit UrtB [Tepidisphaeraceae bacterium]|nr:urea ABC transporter permease subunit UrtB [Tepidisphaeraceae bacterium]